MTPESKHSIDNEGQVRRLIDELVKASRAKNADKVIANYAPDVHAFDVINPLQFVGADAVKKRAEHWFSSFEVGPIGFDVSELAINASHDVAFCHSLNHVDARTTDGNKIDMWWRATYCLRKTDGEWKVTHLHNSVPFDMETGKASLDLKP